MLVVFVVVLLLVATCAMGKPSLDFSAPETPVVFSCLSMIEGSYQFGFTGDSMWVGSCTYPPKVATYTTCFAESELDFNKTLLGFVIMCQSFGGIEVTIDELYEIHLNGTRYLIDPSKQNLTGNILYQPVIPDLARVNGLLKLYVGYFNSVNRAAEYGSLLNNYWIISLLLISLFNMLKGTRLNNLMKHKLIGKIRSLITIPTFTKSHLQAYKIGNFFETLLPTMQEFWLLVIYFGVCIYGASTEYVVFPHNPLFGDKTMQWTRYIADRTGILAFTQLPLLFLFGGRNNLLIKFTGLQYNSFIMFHKWISRLMFSCGLIHGVCYIIYAIHGNRLQIDLNETYWICGCIALLASLGIMIQAFYRFRKVCYEIFLIIHIVLLLIFIACCVVHCWKIGWLQFCFYSIALWAFDRMMRIYRISRFGFPKAMVEILSTIDPTLKITIPKPQNYKTFPGCYVFIHFLNLNFKFWESHPFTIFEIDNQIMIILKPKLGMTMSLYKHLLKTKDHKFELRVAIEGPYGHHVSKKYAQKVMLLAGGNGIPGPFYHALSILMNINDIDQNESGNSKVKLCWVIRDLESLNWFNKELQLIMNKIDIEVYVTREKLPKISDYGSTTSLTTIDTVNNNNNNDNNNFQFFKLNSNIKFYNLRPDFMKLIRNEIMENDLHDISIISCGNPMMCDSIRNCCANMIDEFSDVRVDLYEELQVW